MSGELPLGVAATDQTTASAPNVPEYTVGELSQLLKRTVEDAFGYVRLRGEVSGFRGRHSSGHAYFALKDDGARIEAVCWRANWARLRFKPEEGMEVVVTGRLTTYPGRSTYQIVIESLEPAGVGALMAMLEERRKALAAEGLFDAARKRPLPFMPAVIGVITSPTGAVIRDIMHRLAERCPCRLILWPVRVQGETCAAEVAAAIRGFNQLSREDAVPRPDVIIVARGGGSIEDLWGFNEEIVVRAAAESTIPLISAVGHETDWTLIDHAADLRAPTPTAAAELAVPVRSDLVLRVTQCGRRLVQGLWRRLEESSTALKAAVRGLPRPDAVLGQPRQRVDAAAANLPRALRANTLAHRARFDTCRMRLSDRPLRRHVEVMGELVTDYGRRARSGLSRTLESKGSQLSGCAKLLRSLGPQSVLERGFALVLDHAGHPVRSADDATAGMRARVRFHDGEVPARFEQRQASERRDPVPRRRPSDADQGTLL